jgi:hypothetical protein
LEANSITTTEAFQTYSELICQLQERKTQTFIPSSEFYDVIKTNKPFLKKVMCEKYN